MSVFTHLLTKEQHREVGARLKRISDDVRSIRQIIQIAYPVDDPARRWLGKFEKPMETLKCVMDDHWFEEKHGDARDTPYYGWADLEESSDAMPQKRIEPCPFCGSHKTKARAVQKETRWLNSVVCDSCGATGPTCYNRTNAISKWNQRALSKVLDVEI